MIYNERQEAVAVFESSRDDEPKEARVSTRQLLQMPIKSARCLELLVVVVHVSGFISVLCVCGEDPFCCHAAANRLDRYRHSHYLFVVCWKES
jgi:hypothetical protein